MNQSTSGEVVNPLDFAFQDSAQSRAFQQDGPFALGMSEFREGSPLHFVIGDNGAGKSYLVKSLASRLSRAKVVPLQISMTYRTAQGIERAFMYGRESDQSTGLCSVGTARRAIRSMEGWTEPHVGLFDEPDIGLSETYAYPLGMRIAQFAVAPAEKTRGVVIVTHSRALVKGALSILQAAGIAPSVVCLGNKFSNLAEFLQEPVYATLEELDKLEEFNRVVRSAVNKLTSR